MRKNLLSGRFRCVTKQSLCFVFHQYCSLMYNLWTFLWIYWEFQNRLSTGNVHNIWYTLSRTSEEKEWTLHKISFENTALNPEKPGLFGQLNTRGKGVESTHFGKRTLTPPHFHSRPTKGISYESWHILLKFDTLLMLLRLNLQPREVAKVARVKTKKQLIKNFEIGNFGATKTLYTSKESREESLFRFEIKLETFVLNFFFNLLKFSRLLKKRLFFLFCKLSHFLWKLIGYPILSIALRNRAGYTWVQNVCPG